MNSTIKHQLYTTSTEAWDAMLEGIQNAKRNIVLEIYYFQPGEIGRKFAEVLSAKARSGIPVRCLFDAAGSFELGRSELVEEMRAAGVKIKFFNWLRPFSRGFHKLQYFRNHRRLLLIDFDDDYLGDTIAFNGGTCIGDSARKWNELTIKIAGETTEPFSEMNYAFNEMWENSESNHSSWIDTLKNIWQKMWSKFNPKQTNGSITESFKGFVHKMRDRKRTKLALKRILFSDSFNQPILFVKQSPFPGRHLMYRLLIKKISRAKKYILITTPYFLPDHRIMRKLAAARRRGVQVDIIIPLKTDFAIVDIGCRTYMDYFLNNNINIYRHPHMIHGKGVVIDGNWAMIGTMNFDNVSLRYNFESGITCGSTEFINTIDTALNALKSDSKHLVFKDWYKRNLSDKLAEMVVWPFRKLL